MHPLGYTLFDIVIVSWVTNADPTVFKQKVTSSDERDPITILSPTLDVRGPLRLVYLADPDSNRVITGVEPVTFLTESRLVC